eukprot:4889108-Amphidinium_carterae.1
MFGTPLQGNLCTHSRLVVLLLSTHVREAGGGDMMEPQKVGTYNAGLSSCARGCCFGAYCQTNRA